MIHTSAAPTLSLLYGKIGFGLMQFSVGPRILCNTYFNDRKVLSPELAEGFVHNKGLQDPLGVLLGSQSRISLSGSFLPSHEATTKEEQEVSKLSEAIPLGQGSSHSF